MMPLFSYSEEKRCPVKKLLFIYNPRAGKAQIRSNLLDIIDIFVKAGFEVTAKPTQSSGDAMKSVVERGSDYDLLVCSGGDGTLDEVVTGMMKCEKRLPIGYVPAGSTNDFARSLGISSNMIEAAKNIVAGHFFQCDIGAFNDDTFVYIAAFGLFTEVSYETRQDMKNVLGHMAYILEGVKRLSAVKSYPMKVKTPDQELEGDFMFGMITNSLSVGGFKRITGKYVELNDGEFEVMLIKRPTNAIELNTIMTALVNRNVTTDLIYCFKASHMEITSEEPVAWTLDGEYGGIHRKVVIHDEKQALAISAPLK